MELKIVLSVMPQASASFAPSLWCRRNCCEVNQRVVSEAAVFLNSVRSRKFLRLQNYFQRGHSLRVFCDVNVDGGLGEEPFGFRDEKMSEEDRKSEGCRTISKSRNGNGRKGSNFPSQFDFLQPAMLGIVPEPPNWPEREAVVWASVEQRAKNFELPLSLRMINKKQQWEAGVRELGELTYCPVRKVFSSMVFVIVELQSYALQMRESLCDEELELIVSKAQREMHLSFAWMFEQVFSQTPPLMIHVMILLVNFSVYSAASHNVPIAETKTTKETLGFSDSSVFLDQELSEAETGLWNSIVDEATKMGGLEDVGIDREAKLRFVSPLSVEIESDDLMHYYRTDFLYQIMLSQDPHNSLLLCNYAQFLQLVRHDYDRAEECLKRAVQMKPADAEALSQYANFLWMVRKDLSRAEDVFQQAIAVAKPGNPYYASRYANFLWNTGGEETCFPLNAAHD